MSMVVVAFTLASFSVQATDVDLKKSEVKWKGTKVTGEHYGKVALKSAKVELEGENLKNAEFVVDLNSITAEDIQDPEWNKKFITHMKSGDFFEVEKYPTAKLVTKKIEGNKVKADLTIKGKTHPVEFTYKKDGNAYTGDFTFDRTKFDMIYGSGNFFKNLGDKVIHDKVELGFKVVLK